MIQIKSIDPKFANSDSETKRQLWELNVAEAFKSAVSESELKEKDSIIQTLKFDVIDLGKRLAILSDAVRKLQEPKSSLQVKVVPKSEEKPSLLSELMKVIINRNKR